MPQIGQHKIVELIYNVRRAQFNAEVSDIPGAARQSFDTLAGGDVKEAITAEVRAYYESNQPTGDVVTDAILETLR